MDINTAKEVLACFSQEKTVFFYGKDQYAVFLLSHFIGEACSIAQLKQTSYARLSNTPLAKEIIANSGDGWLRKDQLTSVWPKATEAFLLTLDLWGSNDRSYDQTSRDGYSLVLQLNFTSKHESLFKTLTKPDNHYFNHHAHPALKAKQREYFRETLAWSRMDIDFNHNEVLIEELQTDWLRSAQDVVEDYKNGCLDSHYYGVNTTPEKLNLYARKVLDSYGDIWREALLTATLQFILGEIGIRQIYMHTPDTGAAIKRIKYRKPPRSLYSELPKRFCFKLTHHAPQFIAKTKQFRKVEQQMGETQWNYLNLGGNYADITRATAEKSDRPITLAA